MIDFKPKVAADDVICIAAECFSKYLIPRSGEYCFSGRNNFVLVADIQKESGTLQRPLKKLVPIVKCVFFFVVFLHHLNFVFN